MRYFQIEATDGQGAFLIATTHTAAEALPALGVAQERHTRAWVTDESGNDISMIDLIYEASKEF